MSDTSSPNPASPDLVGEDLFVEDAKWGRVYVRNKRPKGVEKFGPERIVIFQHGATYGSTAFDMAFSGLSWMDYAAARGFDTYCLDLPGYGRSARPPQMDQPADQNPPFMRTPDAASCLGTVVDFVRDRRGADKLCLVGWSWGTAITATFTSANVDKVARLALYAPVWDRSDSGPSPIHVAGKLGAYRTVDREASLKRRQAGLDEAHKGKIMPPEWFEQWWSATVAADQRGDGKTVSAPNGVVLDGAEYWNVGKPLYDPARLSVPLLITVGEWDNDTPPYMAQTIFPLAKSAPWKRLAVLGGGTHTMLMERNRMLLFRTVQQFLEEAPPGPDVHQ
ncbi:MAG: alpha/beta fold hydrolase [Hyphomicrobiaceae bacterium]